MALHLQVIICSTRPGRVGPTIARWFSQYAQEHTLFNVELVDIANFSLPVYNEAHHPRTGIYEHEHTKQWSKSVSRADAYVFVTPEYNYFPTPAFINAINYVYDEWNYKPCGFVSYGGISGGLRATQMERLLATTVKMMPMVECVTLPMIHTLLNPDNGVFETTERINQSAMTMLQELGRWAPALKTIRDKSVDNIV